jgi:hypothetical protein
MAVACILSANAYNLRSKTRRRRNGVKFKFAYSRDCVYSEYVNIDKDKMKGGNKTIVRRLVGVYGPKIVEKQLDDLVKLGPTYYPSWSDIGSIEQKMKVNKFRHLVRVSDYKMKKAFFSILKDNVVDDPMDIIRV